LVQFVHLVHLVHVRLPEPHAACKTLKNLVAGQTVKAEADGAFLFTGRGIFEIGS